eukprot:PhF_6_TR41286/c0_g1_i2/m.62462
MFCKIARTPAGTVALSFVLTIVMYTVLRNSDYVTITRRIPSSLTSIKALNPDVASSSPDTQTTKIPLPPSMTEQQKMEDQPTNQPEGAQTIHSPSDNIEQHTVPPNRTPHTHQSGSCVLEAIPTTYLPYEMKVNGLFSTCPRVPVHQGNYTSPDDVLQLLRVPILQWPKNKTVQPLSTEEINWFWAHDGQEDVHNRTCMPCAGSRLHNVPQTARRWWAPIQWDDEPNHIMDTIVLTRSRLYSSRNTELNKFYGKEIYLPDITKCVFTKKEVTIETKSSQIHVIRFLLPSIYRSMWYTIRMLAPWLDSKCTFPSSEDPPTYAYLPCVSDEDLNYMRVAKEVGGLGTYGIRWKSKCDQKVVVNHESCPNVPRGLDGDPTTSATSEPKPVKRPKVAVCLSGFFRTFRSTKISLWYYLIRPNNATLFMATWNVFGRVKVSKEADRALPVPPLEMEKVLRKEYSADLVEFGGVKVLDYTDMERQAHLHNLFRAGFRRPGNYFLTSYVLGMVPKGKYDIIVRTRFDMKLQEPMELFFHPTQQGQFVLRVVHSCLVDGHWWPQHALLDQNKVIKHFADTRFRLYTWQTCDWIEIGGAQAMQTYASIWNWSVNNLVHAYSQNVEYAFFAEHGIAWQPMHLHVRIARKNSPTKGDQKSFG